ncbi:IS5 family transposase domain protein [Candidatus Bealeia paramacronuclearis]|uniref:IS5 family transposase domain protein n=1 Tax=Candidatus Bealeia paramacronuclearis TaxID=1921001 RepID=A0ABZ2C632_9PROT|nr:IS5 family transposase domain protein [Candidatus Bealeia paramacronuclearis]MEB3702667.1 IS5 family transposase domain protein [Candidatus Bealeia paramacronuclearis]
MSPVAGGFFEDIIGCYVLGDAGYDSDRYRRDLMSNNNIAVIPGRKNRKIPIDYDKKIYKLRSRIEMFFGKIKENRRLGMRYDKLDSSFLGFITLASLNIFLKSTIS